MEKLDKEGYLTRYGYTDRGNVDHVTYADGREVKLSYNPLRQLEEMEDWLGITRIENAPMGRAIKVQYLDGKEVSYTYGKGGERTSITYPDGTEITYKYDSWLRLSGLKDGSGTISYEYDERGRLAQKTFPNGMETTYAYGYDLTRNKTTIEKQRRGLPEESGAYAYNAMNQLIRKADAMNEETYAYDKRGNLSLILENGDIKNRYLYGALNRLEQAVNGRGEAAAYTYNGLGHRVGKMTGAMEGTAGMQEETGKESRYYLQDELGSPIRLMDQNGKLTESYGYDKTAGTYYA